MNVRDLLSVKTRQNHRLFISSSFRRNAGLHCRRPQQRTWNLSLEPLEDRQLLSASPQLIDINCVGIATSPANLMQVGDQLFFTADDAVHGNELWVTDGSDEGTRLVKDIAAGLSPSSPYELTDVNGTLFFTAIDTFQVRQLWKSDGTEAGTMLVKAIGNGDPFRLGNGLTDVNGTLFFVADDVVHGRELWKSDGTEAGTVIVKDITPGVAHHFGGPAYLTNVNGTLFFIANDDTHGSELWKSDGTNAGTVLVKDIVPGPSGVEDGGRGMEVTAVGDTLFFSVNDFVSGVGRELWMSDGTTAGTVMVKDIRGPDSTGQNNGSDPKYLHDFNGTLVFNALDNEGFKLWKSDGTEAGTVALKDYGFTFERDFTNLGDTLYFTVNDGGNFSDLWKSDGTDVGTVLVKLGMTIPSSLTNVNGALFFTTQDNFPQTQLWKSDGTEASTEFVKAIGTFINPRYRASFGDTLMFTADMGFGVELWKSDGTDAGTVSVPVSDGTRPSGAGGFVVSLNGTVFFSASDGLHGRQLWKSDGTREGTALVKDLGIGNGFGSDVGQLTKASGTLFFTANDGTSGNELWNTDGTEAGTVMVKDIGSSSNGSYPQNLKDVNGTLFFTVNNSLGGTELWKSDGAESDTVLVKNFDLLFGGLTVVNDIVFFSANDGVTGRELWKSDGTESGTVLVKDIGPLVSGSYPQVLANVNGTLFFSAFYSQLWKSDGTESGTILVKDFSSFSASGFSTVDDTLFFTFNDDINGWELWKSDGTEAGTLLVKDLNPGFAHSFPNELTNVDGTLFFSAYDVMHGRELWKSDGTEAGTLLVKDIDRREGNPRSLANVNGTLYFSQYGSELWRSDGTDVGTVRVADINSPSQFTLANDTLFFSADDGVHGSELWTLQLEIPSSHGDFNGDHLHNCADVDALVDAIHAGTNNAIYDLTGDSAVNRDDLDAWLTEAAIANGFTQSYLRGDATLDGKVNALDLNVVGLGWQKPVTGWCRGDFDASGMVNASDLNLLAINWRTDIAAVAAAGPVADEALQAVLGRPENARTPRAPLAAIMSPAIAEQVRESPGRTAGQDSLPFKMSDWQARNRLEESIPIQHFGATGAERGDRSRVSIRRYDLPHVARAETDRTQDLAILQPTEANATRRFWGRDG